MVVVRHEIVMCRLLRLQRLKIFEVLSWAGDWESGVAYLTARYLTTQLLGRYSSFASCGGSSLLDARMTHCPSFLSTFPSYDKVSLKHALTHEWRDGFGLEKGIIFLTVLGLLDNDGLPPVWHFIFTGWRFIDRWDVSDGAIGLADLAAINKLLTI